MPYSGGSGIITASSFDPATIAWVNAVVAAGGTVSVTQRNTVDTLISGLKADGNWTNLIRLWLWGGESSAQQATIDIVNLVVGTNTSLALGASGYTGNGTNAFFDTNTNLSTVGTVSLNSTSVGVYIINSRTTNQGYRACGVDTGGASNFVNITPLWSDGNVYYSVNDNGTPSVVGSNAQGQWIASRTGASAVALRRNQTAFTSGSTASTAMANFNFFFFARNQSGGAVDFSADIHAAGFMGVGLTSAQSDQVAARINAYMTAWLINVY